MIVTGTSVVLMATDSIGLKLSADLGWLYVDDEWTETFLDRDSARERWFELGGDPAEFDTATAHLDALD